MADVRIKSTFRDAVSAVASNPSPETWATLGAFLGKAHMEEYKPVEFSSLTGEPVRYDWLSLDWRVWTGKLHAFDTYALFPSMRPGDLTAVAPELALEFVPKHTETGGTIPAYWRLRHIVRIPSLSPPTP